MDATSGVGDERTPWFSQYVVSVPMVQHDLLKSPDKFINKFDSVKKKIPPNTTLSNVCYLSTS